MKNNESNFLKAHRKYCELYSLCQEGPTIIGSGQYQFTYWVEFSEAYTSDYIWDINGVENIDLFVKITLSDISTHLYLGF
jgi:hypothetical protein